MKVIELMKVHVIRASADATLGDAVDMMDLYQVTALPVVDQEDRILGIVTERDITEWVLPSYVQKSGTPAPAPERTAPLNQRMSTDIISVDEGEEVLHAAELMLARSLKRLPVTSNGRLAGTISRIDICQAFLEGQITNAAEQNKA